MQLSIDILFLLLSLALLSGWIMGRRSRVKTAARACQKTTIAYVKGLNYLLSDEEDKAVDLLLQLSQDNPASSEIQFALANLYRRQGEVELAIGIHQNLITQSTLERELHNRALYELGLDHLKLGRLERAESLFIELKDDRQFGEQSTHHLLVIYRQKKEWEKAAAIATRLLKHAPELKTELAHYYCEMAEQALSENDNKQATRLTKQALFVDSNSIRASLIEGALFYRQNQLQQALNAYRCTETQYPDLLPQLFPVIVSTYLEMGREQELIEYVDKLLHQYPTLALATVIYQTQFPQEITESVRDILSDYLHSHPSILTLKYLIEEKRGGRDEALFNISKVVEKLWQSEEIYHCAKCGFRSTSFSWNCPSCQNWATMTIDNNLTASTDNHLLGIENR